MEYNVADDSSNYFNNKWRHHDITTIICVLANFLILSDTLLATLRREIDEIWVLPRNSTIWRHNDVKLRRCVNHFIPWCWKWWVYTIQSNFGGRVMSGRRQQNKKARSEYRVKLTSARKIFHGLYSYQP